MKTIDLILSPNAHATSIDTQLASAATNIIFSKQTSPRNLLYRQSLAVLSISIATAAFTCVASEPCTNYEIDRSKSYYDTEGYRLPNAVGRTPKFCPTSSTKPSYSECEKPGFDAAALFMQDNKNIVRRALTTSGEVYSVYAKSFRPYTEYAARGKCKTSRGCQDAPEATGKSATSNQPPRVLTGKYIAAKQSGSSWAVDKISLPSMHDSIFFLDRESGAVVGLSMSPSKAAGRQILTIAFKGSVPGAPESDFIGDNFPQEFGSTPPKYAFAERIGFEIYTLLKAVGKECATSIVYTGHSLGGGLALFAGRSSGIRCDRKPDAVITFNTARPQPSNAASLERRSSSVNIIVDFAAQNEIIQRLRFLSKDRVIERLGSDAQVLRFSNITVPGKDSIRGHFLGNLADEINMVMDQVPDRGQRISSTASSMLCEWYVPLDRR